MQMSGHSPPKMAGHANFRDPSPRGGGSYTALRMPRQSDFDMPNDDGSLPPSPRLRRSSRLARNDVSSDLPSRRQLTRYASGSGESDGFASCFFSSGPIGTLRFRPFGGIFCV